MHDASSIKRTFLSFLLSAAAVGCADDRMPAEPAPLSDCVIFGIGGISSLPVGATGVLGGYQESCRPMFLPLPPDLITWVSLDSSIASVNAGIVRGIAPGPAVIQGTYGRMSQQVLVIVEGAPPPGSASPIRLRMVGCPTMTVLQRGNFGVFAIFENGAVSRVSAVWASSRPAVAGFSTAGAGAEGQTVDAFNAGTTRIVSQYQRLIATMTVEVAGQ